MKFYDCPKHGRFLTEKVGEGLSVYHLDKTLHSLPMIGFEIEGCPFCVRKIPQFMGSTKRREE